MEAFGKETCRKDTASRTRKSNITTDLREIGRTGVDSIDADGLFGKREFGSHCSITTLQPACKHDTLI